MILRHPLRATPAGPVGWTGRPRGASSDPREGATLLACSIGQRPSREPARRARLPRSMTVGWPVRGRPGRRRAATQAVPWFIGGELAQSEGADEETRGWSFRPTPALACVSSRRRTWFWARSRGPDFGSRPVRRRRR
jgi:hypothetical protein